MCSYSHGDIKSPNVLVTRSFVAKLADFGTVRIVPELAVAGHMTTRNVIGTGPYMPPEYTFAGHVSAKTDTFAFGTVLLELLARLLLLIIFLALSFTPPQRTIVMETMRSRLQAHVNSVRRCACLRLRARRPLFFLRAASKCRRAPPSQRPQKKLRAISPEGRAA